MTRRFAARVILASALLVPVVVGAAPSRLQQTTQVDSAFRRSVTPSQTGVSISVDPLDPQHARLVITDQDGGTWILDASSMSMTYTATGLVVDMKGPGTFTTNGMTDPVSDLGTAQLIFKDGKLVKMQHSGGGRKFPCPSAGNVRQPGCAGRSSSG